MSLLTQLEQWFDDIEWAVAVIKARRYRRSVSFSKRRAFDQGLMPILGNGSRIAYPDAFYYLTKDDVRRACTFF